MKLVSTKMQNQKITTRIAERMRQLAPRIKANQTKIVVGIFLLALTAVLLFLVADNFRMRNQLSNPDTLTEAQIAAETAALVTKVSRHMLLPEEEPTIYTITDVALAQTTYGDFFQNAQNNDKLLLFTGKAFLYRPSTDLVINAGPWTMTQTETGVE